MTHKRLLQDRAKTILKNWATPVLHQAGFKKSGIVYCRRFGNVHHVLNTESDDLNTAEQISFTLNCGVHIDRVFGVRWKREPTKLKAAGCLLHVRPGFLTPGGNPWWYLTSADGPDRDSEVGQEIKTLLETAALPFFDRFRDEASVAEFLSQPREKKDRFINPRVESVCFTYAGIIWNQLGAFDKCQACMTRAAELAKGKRLEADVERFAKSFVCGGTPAEPGPRSGAT